LKEIMARWVLLPAMDLLADGAIILRLLVHLLDNSHPQSIELLPYPMVPTLRGFVFNNSSQSTSVRAITSISFQHVLTHIISMFCRDYEWD
jgi:hypothetical protein